MKSVFRFPLVALIPCFLLISAAAQAQTKAPAKPLRYKDVVVDNPTAERDMKVVGDFANALVAGDTNKVRTLVSATFVGRGPAATDSATIDKTLKAWEANYKTQSNRKITFVTQTFRVLSGNLKGNWVSMWGDYTFTDVQTGKTVSFPLQYTANVADGKITGDRIYYDRMYILTQLGYTVTPPEVAKK